jgi:hypothetical protein
MTKSAPREAFDGFALVQTKASGRRRRDAARSAGAAAPSGVECAAEEKQEAVALYWATQILFAMLLRVAVTIALFGLVASMATAVIERRWEVGRAQGR